MMPDTAYPALTAAPNAADLALREAERASAYASLSAATLRAYAESWADFEAWTTQRGLPSLPAAPETVGRYLADCADRGRAVATLRRRAAAIARAHAARALTDPCASVYVRNVLSGIARHPGGAQKKKDALTLERLRAGVITTAAAAHVSEIDIARISGHKSADVLRGYVRRATVLEAPPLAVMIMPNDTA